jgi:hypothetical protein
MRGKTDGVLLPIKFLKIAPKDCPGLCRQKLRDNGHREIPVTGISLGRTLGRQPITMSLTFWPGKSYWSFIRKWVRSTPNLTLCQLTFIREFLGRIIISATSDQVLWPSGTSRPGISEADSDMNVSLRYRMTLDQYASNKLALLRWDYYQLDTTDTLDTRLITLR